MSFGIRESAKREYIKGDTKANRRRNVHIVEKKENDITYIIIIQICHLNSKTPVSRDPLLLCFVLILPTFLLLLLYLIYMEKLTLIG